MKAAHILDLMSTEIRLIQNSVMPILLNCPFKVSIYHSCNLPHHTKCHIECGYPHSKLTDKSFDRCPQLQLGPIYHSKLNEVSVLQLFGISKIWVQKHNSGIVATLELEVFTTTNVKAPMNSLYVKQLLLSHGNFCSCVTT